MRVLITGATGLIGSRIVKELHAGGIPVNYLTTSKDKIEDSENYRGFYWNPKEGEIDKKAFEGVLAIINLAGASIAKRWTKSYKKTILESRTSSANLLYKTLQEIDHSVQHLISASGISIYPNSKVKMYTEENTQVDNTFLAEVVVAWEAAADQFKNLGIRVAKVRTGVVLSEEDGALSKMVKPIEYGVGAPLGSGRQWISWIHLNDICCIYYHILQNGLEGVFNAVAANPVTNQKMTQKIAKEVGKSLWLPNVPSFMLKLILGEMAILVLEGQLVSCKKIEKTGYEFQYVNIETALRDLL